MILVRYFAAARAAAGIDEEKLDLSTGTSVGGVLDAVGGRHGEALRQVLRRCSVLVNGVASRDPHRDVGEGAVVDVLPPFAGG